MKNELEISLNSNFSCNEEKSWLEKFIISVKELIVSTIKITALFITISSISVILFSWYKQDKNNQVNTISLSYERIKKFWILVIDFSKKPFTNEIEKKDFSNIFFPTIITSLISTAFITTNWEFSNGFNKGFEKSRIISNLKKQEEILEKSFIQEKLIKSIEDLENKIIKLQYDFSEFSELIQNSKSHQGIRYDEIQNNSNSEIDNLKRKIETLENALDKLNGNIFDLGLNMSRSNNSWKFNRRNSRLNSQRQERDS